MDHTSEVDDNEWKCEKRGKNWKDERKMKKKKNMKTNN